MTSSGPIPEAQGCPSVGSSAPQPKYVTVGALQVLVPDRPPTHDHPSALLPSGVPAAPYQLAASAVTNYAPDPPVNPTLAMGYYFQLCNGTSAAHRLSSLNATIASFAPSSGPVAVWHMCQDGPYNAATKQTASGCGGGIGASDFLAATFSSDHNGATAPAKANGHGGVDLPLSIDAHHSIDLYAAINGLTSQGTYTLSFDFSVDGAAPTTLTPSDGAFLIAPSAAIWTGTACQTPAMQAHIPAATQDTYYVCPPAA
jgi:hypothetical protein